jgi:outer membrane protein assembly factor BamB
MPGNTLAGTRNQPAETVLNAGSVPNVDVLWTYDTAGAGGMQNTPVVADGCVYVATNTGWVIALNAEDGKHVWATPVEGTPAGTLLGGVITGSPTVVDGTVYVAVSELHDPRVVAIRQSDGAILWTVHILDDAKRPDASTGSCGDGLCSYRNTVTAAPVVWNGVLFQGIMADENSAVPRGGYAIVDVTDQPEYAQDPDARLLLQDWTITQAEYDAGYRGVSIWCTAAVDEATGYAYACGGNPASKQIEARTANALLKIDLDQGRPTFGTMVDSYKGNVDQYYPGLDRQPACDQVPTTLVWSPTCVQFDLDFGASPNLFVDDVGRPIVGALQKSGVYHAVFTDHMAQAWTSVVGLPGPTFNAASAAVDDVAAGGPDGGKVYTAAVPPGQMWALSKDRGRYRWASPILTGPATHFQPVSTANGVVYSMDNAGTLHAIDAATGVPVLVRNLGAEVGTYAGDLSSQGVSIARNTIYAASSSFVVALR